MYKLSVPFMLDQIDKYCVTPFIDELKKINADIVFLALDSYETDKEKAEKVLQVLWIYALITPLRKMLTVALIK